MNFAKPNLAFAVIQTVKVSASLLLWEGGAKPRNETSHSLRLS